ncbi:MAG: hypothetical protein LBL83_00855 [Clostridiales bacterium]|jgi:hypothetical protein|nr:hypothetical protein [Clostridiales bacterium]
MNKRKRLISATTAATARLAVIAAILLAALALRPPCVTFASVAPEQGSAAHGAAAIAGRLALLSPAGSGNSAIVFFSTVACDECERAKTLLSGLPAYVALPGGSNSALAVETVSIMDDGGVDAIRRFFEAYEVPSEKQLTPILFYAGGYLSGADEIEGSLRAILSEGGALGFSESPAAAAALSSLAGAEPGPGNGAEPGAETGAALGAESGAGLQQQQPRQPGGGRGEPTAPARLAELAAMLLAGLLGGVNPCSVSMLLLLLSLLAAKQSRIALIGFSYLAGKFIAYAAIGFSLFSAASLLDSGAFATLKAAARVVTIAFAALLCAMNAADFFSARAERYGKIRAQLPKALRRFNNGLIERHLGKSPRFLALSSLALGMVVSAGEFLCTGQIYLAAIIYQIRANTGAAPAATASLLAYCAASAAPAAALILLCSRGRKALELSETFRRHMPLIKLANAALFALIAVAALLLY